MIFQRDGLGVDAAVEYSPSEAAVRLLVTVDQPLLRPLTVLLRRSRYLARLTAPTGIAGPPWWAIDRLCAAVHLVR